MWMCYIGENEVVAAQAFFIFTPIIGEMIQFDKYIFQNGLKPPTSHGARSAPSRLLCYKWSFPKQRSFNWGSQFSPTVDGQIIQTLDSFIPRAPQISKLFSFSKG